ncbi:cytochrome p450 monooxygenase [Colletotrichum truncatum]|uniref:Cytochrome p450 monooxygenase n=1 Tax=Colletotrichum truncatum TaxID=5467 RepID=A0ACC3ZB48_COLTU|nr:cytochrome p450 monooxygenase [Colletotrichum truncatum]KAF6787668.1 cytochrome p450 monooxygenase [Colletotrichum truncatum]
MFSSLPPVLVASLAVYLLIKFYKAFTNPLNVVPGPWYARFTELPGTVATLQKQGVQYYHALHQKYGPYVRVAPEKVFVSDVDAFKAIHKVGSHFRKADYYHYFGPTEAGKPPYGLFQMTDTNDHAQRRKLLGRGFTVSSLRGDWEDMVREKVSIAIEAMRHDAETANGEVDIRKWWVFMASDITSRLMFGKSFDALKTGKEDPWFEDLNIAISAAFAALSFPRFYAVAKRLPIIGGLRMFSSHKVLLDKGRIAVENSKQTTTLQNANLFTKVLSQAEKDDGSLTNEEICVEAASFMVAGSDTTSNTLTYAIWAVLSRPELQKALEAELIGIEEPYNDADLEKLPILHAVLEETLRLYGAAPTPVPRVVPPGGSQLGGYRLPAGTIVATQSWTLHRDPQIFSNPDIFDHSRWLPGGEYTKSEAARAVYTPFGTGSRVCIGKHLAYMELRYGLVLFFRKFSGARLSPATTPESMEIDNIMLIEPRGKTCRVILP